MVNSRQLKQRGVSLIEALVAFGVMAFGMLAVVGMQASLRVNGDLARQRSEAVRMAQAEIEQLRGFSVMTTTTGKAAYADVVAAAPLATSTENVNTVYTLTRHVTAEPVLAGAHAAARQTVIVEVTWQDRNDQPQLVRLSTVIAGIEPALEGSLVLGMNTDLLVQPGGRNRAIPPAAVNIGGGNSGYVPPGQAPAAGYVAWVFNNTTAVIRLCTTSAASSAALTASSIDLSACSGNALLLAGYIRYDDSTPPSSATASNPEGTPVDLSISVDAPAAASTPLCFSEIPTSSRGTRVYYCAVPVGAGTAPSWTGTIRFVSPLVALTTSASADLPGLYKVCRYGGVPLAYSAQSTAAINQNFLVTRAGSAVGSTAGPYPCPSPFGTFQP